MQTLTPRRLKDRRQPPPFFSKYSLGISGRRSTVRREGDTGVYVDQYDWPVFLVAVGIVIMSAMDATFTLRLLTLGAIEINTVMNVLIESNVYKFVAFKLGLTTLGVLLLVIHKNVHLSLGFSVYRLAQAIFLGYVVLIGYELWMFHMLTN
ncbi:MAG: DUF5658 family protein [Gammaproteobacteria bacterium]